VAFDPGDLDNCLPGFNGGFPGLPEMLPFTPHLLARAGFRIATRELHLTLAPELDGPRGEDEALAIWSAPTGSMPALVRMNVSVSDDGFVEVDAVRGKRRVGSARAHILGSDKEHEALTGYITWLGVDEDERRQGIGRALLDQTVSLLADQDARRIFLTTGSQNWTAQSLYLVSGFKVVGTSISLVRYSDPGTIDRGIT
jgi:ribosomal protein S18 acetylase RimI-like enzyme